jgi:proteasome assembly chaperone (PAC2) family protein
MILEFMIDWLATVGKKRAEVLLRKLGMLLVLNVFNEHLTPQIKTSISSINMDLVVISQGMTLHLQILDVLVNKSLNIT